MREKKYFKYLSEFQNDRLRLKIKTGGGKVVDMVVQYETKVEGHWKPVVRYDCSHGFFQRDAIYPSGDKEKKAIPIEDLDAALTYAEQDIRGRWEFYREKHKRPKK